MYIQTCAEVHTVFLRTGLLPLLLEQGEETHTRDLHDLETHTGDITLRLTLAAETRDKHLVVLVHVVKATVVGHEGRHLLAVLDQLHTHTLADGRVGLLSLDTDLLKNNALGVRGTTSRRGLVEVAERALLEVSVTLRC